MRLKGVRSFSRPLQMLLVNQFAINLGFYMLMPFLAGHLRGDLGLATWLVGLILGVRNFSQQGLFLLGGTAADRWGYRRTIMAGCGLRTIGFALYGISGSVPALVAASVLTGVAGALFAPAVRAYVGHEAGARRVEAFSVFNVFYQGGILVGPLVGMALIAFSFQAVCLAAAAVFALLTAMQARYLPERSEEREERRRFLDSWRVIFANRGFLAFALTMSASYALAFQVYLGLPLEVRRLSGGDAGVAVLFSLPAALSVFGQVRIARWCSGRWTPGQSMVRGLVLMASSFGILIGSAHWPVIPASGIAALVPVMACVVVLTIGQLMVFPFEMSTIADLSGGRLLASYYGCYGLLSAIGIIAGNLVVGFAFDRGEGSDVLPWMILAGTGAVSGLALHVLVRRGVLVVPIGSDGPRGTGGLPPSPSCITATRS